jgi:hypothetical protein
VGNLDAKRKFVHDTDQLATLGFGNSNRLHVVDLSVDEWPRCSVRF